jgi:hypothetical protein
MQAPDQHDTGTQDGLTKKVEYQLELSEVWRQLLGLETVEVAATRVDNQEAVPILNHDPWNSLTHEQGIQVVDLQKTHVHTAQAGDEENDVEHALDMMQEQEKKPEK